MSGFDGIPWINPIGGLGDVLMISGVLKQALERDPARRFRLIRRPGYMCLLAGHPAVVGAGFPRPGEPILRVDYWSDPAYGSGLRPMPILARQLGVEGPIEERFFVVEDETPDPLFERVPWGTFNVAIAPGSASPRKEWSLPRWIELVARFRGQGFFVLQMGNMSAPHVRGAYSICGLTTPRQVFRYLRRVDMLVTVDNFFVHAAHHTGTRTLALWGPTDPALYGYPEQKHLVGDSACDKPDGCIAPGKGENYTRPCPRGADRCLDRISAERVWAEIRDSHQFIPKRI
jgi:ADP-heptose:LPS heptosyltransferase